MDAHAQTVGREHSPVDRLLMAADAALRTVFADHAAARPCPQAPIETPALSDADKREAIALMRVNHVGEVCAQALYASQGLGTTDPVLRAQFEAAARDETDHLAWTEQRLRELGGRTSLLNPLWFAGSFAIGLVAARAGDQISLGFVNETERQVESHLTSHLRRLPADDHASRAIVEQMRADEVQHADAAMAAGGVVLPAPVRGLMRAVAKVMTTTAHYI
ncbi:2-polyprenyl-3-methyl-6-methoxy-1,4-benzoquinone monooxygenase [Aquabacterium sp.]|uniref:2-polyprenyl-3-methyl-6-methoxy-1,4-benzoquinone monooxygenase n=1 Tax=Aquabacterium sp. TaxID=1872578 RepID=UPI0035B1B43D